MFYTKILLKTIVLAIFLSSFQYVKGQNRLEIGEKIHGPANIRDKANGKILFTLNDGVNVETSPVINKWIKIGVYLQLTPNQIEKFKIEKGINLTNEKGELIGQSLNPIDIVMVEDNIGYVEAYTHQDNINMAFNPEAQLIKILALGNYQKKTLEPFMKKFGFTEYQEDNKLKFKQYFIYESIVVDFSPSDRITLLFDKQNLVGYFHTRYMLVKGFKTYELIRGHKLSVLENMPIQDIKSLIQKRNAYYNSVD